MKKDIENPKMLFQDEQWEENEESFKRYIIVAIWFISILLVVCIACLNIMEIGG